MFCLKEGIVRPTSERITKLLLGIENVLKMESLATARDFLHLLVIMASCIKLIPNASLFMRPIQLHLLSHWKTSSQILETNVPFSKHLKSLLKWWLNQENLNKGRAIIPWNTSITMTTDASKSGYGGHLSKKETFQGIWSRKESLLHINVLEMEAVMLSIQHFLPKLVGKNVLITLGQFNCSKIHKQTRHSPQLCMRTWKLWQLALDNQMLLKAAHIAGKKNILADRLSRFKVQPIEWTVNKKIVLKLFTIWEVPHIDLFASHQTQIYCSWNPNHLAYAIDALTIPWNNMFAYAYPPICLIPKILQHMTQYNCQLILIASHWPRRHWFPNLLKLIADFPRKLPVREDLLHQPKSNILHPNPAVFNLTALLLSTNTLKRKVFLSKLENYSKPLGEKVHRKITLANFENSMADVEEGKLIPIMRL